MKPDLSSAFSTSYLDLLLSALGGVALLVVLFAATRTINDKRIATTAPSRLIVQVLEAPESLLVGREFGLFLEHAGEIIYLSLDGDWIQEERLEVRWAKKPSLNFPIAVRLSSVSPLKLGIWLKQIEPASTDPRPGSTLEQRRHWLLSKTIRLQAFWSQKPDFPVLFQLKRENGFAQIQELVHASEIP